MKVTPPDASAGVRVGDITYPAYPGTSVGIADPTVRVAMFALLYDQDLTTPIGVFAKDAAGNLATQPLDYTPFVKVFKRSNIEISDAFLQRVVPAILQDSPEFASQVSDPSDLIAAFLKINGDLRKKNAEEIASFAKQSAPADALARAVPAARQLAGRGRVRRSPDLHVQGQGDRPASPSRLRPRRHVVGARRRSQQRQSRSREPARHLRQLHHHRPRPRACSRCTRTSRRSR